MSVFSYNSVVISDWYSNEVRCDAVMDPSGVDMMYHRISLSGTGILAPNYSGLSTAQDVANKRYRFLQPRKAISLKIDGDEFFPIPNNGGTVDALNGPIPTHFSVIGPYMEGSVTVSCGVTSHWNLIGTYTEVTNGILSLRWQDQTTIDTEWATRRTRRGKLTIASDSKNRLDDYRNSIIIPGIPSGFKRISSDFVQSENGLSESFTIIDQEVYRVPPPPATTASGRYRETVQKGAMRLASVDVNLRGPKSVPQGRLMSTAITIAIQKLLPGSIRIMEGSFEQDLYENDVSVSLKGAMQAIKPANKFNVAAAGLQVAGDLKRLSVGPRFSEADVRAADLGDRGTANMTLGAASYNVPGTENPMQKESGFLNNGPRPGG